MPTGSNQTWTGSPIPKETGMFRWKHYPSPWHLYTQRAWIVRVKAPCQAPLGVASVQTTQITKLPWFIKRLVPIKDTSFFLQSLRHGTLSKRFHLLKVLASEIGNSFHRRVAEIRTPKVSPKQLPWKEKTNLSQQLWCKETMLHLNLAAKHDSSVMLFWFYRHEKWKNGVCNGGLSNGSRNILKAGNGWQYWSL